MGIHEMKGALLQEDLDSWKPLIEWLEQRPPAGQAMLGEGSGFTGAVAPTVSV
jgi:hypothetical protein